MRPLASWGMGERGSWLAVVALTLLLINALANAQGSTVLLSYPENPSPLLREALVHVHGEFSSVDLSVQVASTRETSGTAPPELAPGTYGALVFEEQAGVLVMRAYHPRSAEPIVQRLPVQDGRITPQVVAVRAVETLRAALQQYYHSANRQMPEKVKQFARIREPRPAPARRPRPPRQAPPVRSRTQLAFWFGPSAELDLGNRKPAAGGLLALTVGRRWYYAGATFESTLLPFEFEAESGSATLHRQMALLEFRGRLRLNASSGLFARVGGGVTRFRLNGRAVEGFSSNDATLVTPLLAVGVGGEYWAGSHFGLFVQVSASAALNAPTVRFAGDPSEQVERPLLGLALGGVLGFDR